MALEQTFQKVSGTVALGPIHAGLRDVRLRGAISFAYVDQSGVRRDFTGRVAGNRWKAPSATRRRGRQVDRDEEVSAASNLLVGAVAERLVRARLQPHSQIFCASEC